MGRLVIKVNDFFSEISLFFLIVQFLGHLSKGRECLHESKLNLFRAVIRLLGGKKS